MPLYVSKIYLLLLHGLYHTLSHSQSEESQVHKIYRAAICEKLLVLPLHHIYDSQGLFD